MLVTQTERPRELRWWHAGPMLYGDWGTSRFYVLGLSLYYAQHASFWYVAAVCTLVAAVGWAYTIVCRCYPDGGGVYSAARQTSRMLGVVGALLLFADYIITAALSAIDSMHYLQVQEVVIWLGLAHGVEGAELFVRGAAIFSIFLIGVINFVGPRKAGTFALVVAAGTLVLTVVLAVACFVPQETMSAVSRGWSAIHRPEGGAGHVWHNLVNVVLALSGVEAIANMTGIMVQPVARTSRKAIWPVLLEVVAFNLILAVAMNALPAKYMANSDVAGASHATHTTLAAQEEAQRAIEHAHPGWKSDPALAAEHQRLELTADQRDAQNRVLWVMAKEWVGRPFAAICGVVFGLLLLSAVNTAVADMVSIQYVMSRDAELPHWLMKLNIFGVPWRTLVAAVALPGIVLLITGDLALLAGLYAIGVVGAIAINLSCCCLNRAMPIAWYERAAMGVLAAVLIAIEITLAVGKPSALVFVTVILGGGLGLRYLTKSYLPARARRRTEAAAQALKPAPASTLELGTPPEQLDMSRPKVLVATRGGPALVEFAAQYTRRMGGNMVLMFVRHVNVVTMGPAAPLKIEEDEEARAVFRRATEVCRRVGVPMIPLYVVSPDVAYAILDHAATFGVEAVLMGVSRQGSLLRTLRGDVLAAVADHLPADIPLLIHA